MNKYIFNYCKKEVINKINEIKNDIMRECFGFHNISSISVYFTSDIFSKGSGLAALSVPKLISRQ